MKMTPSCHAFIVPNLSDIFFNFPLAIQIQSWGLRTWELGLATNFQLFLLGGLVEDAKYYYMTWLSYPCILLRDGGVAPTPPLLTFIHNTLWDLQTENLLYPLLILYLCMVTLSLMFSPFFFFFGSKLADTMISDMWHMVKAVVSRYILSWVSCLLLFSRNGVKTKFLR